MDEKMLLEAMGKLMDEKLESIRSEMATKAELNEIRSNMATKAELDEIRSNMATKADLSTLQQQISRVAVFQENTVIKRLDSLAEGITGVGQKFARLDRLESKVDGHSDRIFALESVIKAR